MESALVVQDIYSEFAKSVEKFQKDRGSPDVLVSTQGLAANFKDICTRRAARAGKTEAISEDDRRMLKLEANTWALLQRVYEHRRQPRGTSKTAQDMLRSNPYTPPAALYRAWLSQSPRLAELCEIQKWLESTYYPKEPPLSSKEYWKFTRIDLTQKKRQGQATRTGYVRTLDPDALNRIGDNGTLNADDMEEEKLLLLSLFQHIRAGRVEAAAKLCENSARPWRAALMRGMYHLDWDGLEDLETSSPERVDLWTGNQRWLLWRQTCSRAAMSTSLHVNDRALHAAISPSLTTLPALLPLCRSWEDHLWARLSSLIGDRIEAKFKESIGGFWNRGTSAERLVLLEQADQDVKPDILPDENWEKDIGHELDALTDIAVDTNLPTEDYLRRLQISVIQQKIEPLLTEVEESCGNSNDSIPLSSVRFFAHLWLFLNMINASNDLTKSTIVVEKYIEILQQNGHRELVALYTSFLGQAAIKKYADFLANLPLTTKEPELERALRAAASYHLDVRQVAVEASKLSRDRATKLFPAETKHLPKLSKTDASGDLTEAEKHLKRSLGWLQYHSSTQDLLLRQSNDDTRWLLSRGRVHAATKLRGNLPNSILTNWRGSREHEVEYLLYQKLFELWDQFSILNQMSKEPQEALSGDGLGHWKRRLEDAIEQMYASAEDVLTFGWGVENLEFDDLPEDDRTSELRRLRKIYIPEIVFRLTGQLISFRHYVPSTTVLAMRLVNLVANGRDRLYLDFVHAGQNQLGKYLLMVREAVICGMEDSGSDPLAPSEG